MDDLVPAGATWLLGPLLGLPPWLDHLIFGLGLAYLIGLASFVLARIGRSPLWALLLVLPWLNIFGIPGLLYVGALWTLAYGRWPRYRQAREVPPPAP